MGMRLLLGWDAASGARAMFSPSPEGAAGRCDADRRRGLSHPALLHGREVAPPTSALRQQGGACGSAGRTTEDAAREARKPGGQRSGGVGQALTMVQNSLAVISASYSAECASSPLQGKPAACTARASTVWP